MSAEQSAPLTCDEGVMRGGAFNPCEYPAVAVRRDEEGGWYTVCARHTRGPMVSLSDLLAAFAQGWDARP